MKWFKVGLTKDEIDRDEKASYERYIKRIKEEYKYVNLNILNIQIDYITGQVKIYLDFEGEQIYFSPIGDVKGVGKNIQTNIRYNLYTDYDIENTYNNHKNNLYKYIEFENKKITK